MDDIKIGEILLPGDEDTQARQESNVRAKFWPTMKKAILCHIHFISAVTPSQNTEPFLLLLSV